MGICALAAIGAVTAVFVCFRSEPEPEGPLARYSEDARYASPTVRRPLDGAFFSPEIVPPVFEWDDAGSGSNMWLVSVQFQDRTASRR
jgi:hypothetical protein